MPTRRTFLNQAGAATAFAFAAPVVLAQTGTTDLDIAIVGGGVAGLFCSMRLSEAPGTRVGVFEATDRIGGRLLSLHFPNLTSQTAEIGGMRLRHTDKHALKVVDDMVGREKLQDFAYPITGYYLRGQHFSELSEATDLPYRLIDRERAIIAGGDDLLTHVINDLNKMVTEGALSLRDKGLWELLLQQRSRETYNFMRDVLGYNSPLSNWDSKTAISWFERDFAYKTKYLKLDGGLEQIPKAIARAYMSNGGKVHLKHKLVDLRRRPDAGFDLFFQTQTGQTKVSAARMILAIPPIAFPTLVNTQVFSGNGRFARAVESVHKVPLAKVHLAFDQDWWTRRNLSVGRVITDLPARQIYRWGVDDTSGHALLMASYHDGEMIEYWEALSEGSTFGAPDWIEHATGPDGDPIAQSMRKLLPASDRLVKEVWNQARRSHNLGDNLPEPVAATYQNWGREPWGAAYHLWGIGANPKDIIDYMQEPVPGIHICNEAWSVSQGWTNGAMQSADSLLVAKFEKEPFV